MKRPTLAQLGIMVSIAGGLVMLATNLPKLGPYRCATVQDVRAVEIRLITAEEYITRKQIEDEMRRKIEAGWKPVEGP